MDEDLWFEEEIGPAEETLETLDKTIKGLAPEALAAAVGEPALNDLTKGQQAQYARAFAVGLRGSVLAARPLARPVSPGDTSLPGAAFARGDLYLVRLGVEYRLPERYLDAGCRFRKVWCRAYLSADGPPFPRVLDMAPDRVYQGGPRTVRVEAKPALKWAEVEASLGSVATDVQFGVVSAATVAFAGRDERQPEWEMTEQKHEIRGRYHFWLLLDLPDGCRPEGVRLALLGEGDVRTPLGLAPMGPRSRTRDRQPVMTLARMLQA